MRKLVIIVMCLVFAVASFGCYVFNDTQESITDDETAVNDTYEHDDENDMANAEPDLIESDEPSESESGDLPWGYFPFEFNAVDLYGDDITETTMGERQLFFVHLWGTWCPPCVVEMPEIAIIAQEYGDRVGFLGLLDDFSSNPDGAKNILESAQMPEFFFNVDARLPGLSDIVALVSTGSVPTTIIITSDGLMSEPIVGALGHRYAEILDYLLEME